MAVGPGLAPARNRQDKPRFKLILSQKCGIMGGKTKHFTVSRRVADPDQDCEMTDLPPDLAAFAALPSGPLSLRPGLATVAGRGPCLLPTIDGSCP